MVMIRSFCRKLFYLLGVISMGTLTLHAQYQSYQARGEVGISVGTAHYFGDLNPEGRLSPVHYSAGVYYQRYLNNYIGARININYVHLAADDQDNTNPAYKQRQLNFTNNLLELSISGSFNFFNYAPGNEGHNFTPYVAVGIGGIYSAPYTFDDEGKKVKLREVGTEGQYSSTPHDGQKYSNFTMVFPLSVGIKQALSEKLSLFAELGYRFTRSDYLDDVSSTYAGVDAFAPGNYKGSASQAAAALSLQDRHKGGSPRERGWQRGNSLAKDSYLLMQVGLSYNFGKCNCPLVF
ncbi:MAG TPA: DUF6089 family protein [Arachidicoccus sp.]|nr:DUF6089 family protein [Arachidicoccus sp.]